MRKPLYTLTLWIVILMLLFSLNQEALASAEVTIQPDMEYSGNIGDAGDYDFYRLVIGAPSSLEIRFRHEIPEDFAGWDILLYTASNELLTTFFSGTEDVEMISDKVRVPAGTYRIKVERAANWSDIGYMVTAMVTDESANTFEREDNDTRSRAQAISVNKEYTGNIQDAGDSDYYKFTMAASFDLSIGFMHEVPEDFAGWDIMLYTSDNELLTSFYSGTDDVNLLFEPVSLAAGTYYIKVERAANWNDIDYVLSANMTAQSGGNTETTAPSEPTQEPMESPDIAPIPTASNETASTPAESAQMTETPQITPVDSNPSEFDAYRFLNNPDSFPEDYSISGQYLSMLKEGMGYSIRKLIDDQAKKSWSGSCAGMSASLIAFHNLKLVPDYWQSGAGRISDLEQPDRSMQVNDLIHFYQLMQCLPENIERPHLTNDAEAFMTLTEETKKIAGGGSPVMIIFALKAKSNGRYAEHAIVAYGITENESGYHILIADPNKQITAINLAKDYSSFSFELNGPLKYEYTRMLHILSDPDQISLINPQTGESNVSRYHYSNPLLILKAIMPFYVSSDSGESSSVSEDNYAGDLQIDRVFLMPRVTADGDILDSDACYMLPGEDGYTVQFDNPSEVTLSLCYDGTLEDVSASEAESVYFKPSGGVVLESAPDGTFEISLTFDQPSAEMEWPTVMIAGNAAETTSVEQTPDGIVVEGVGLTDITVTGVQETGQTEIRIPLIQDKFLIAADEQNSGSLAIFLDEDQNGSFEAQMQSAGVSGSSVDVPDNSQTIITVVLLMFGALAVVALATVFIMKKTRR
ncbi:MAG: hypothetical protein ACYCX2_04365 [Christensenellales bacterium]